MQTDAIHIALSYKHILYTEIAYINCFANNLNTFIDKTLVPSFGVPFAYLFIDRKLYYSSGLSLNKSINLTSISL